MEIRRIDIENFRGIKRLVWKIPAHRRFIALIGAGDSSKSTILNALDFALTDRWNLSFSDTDFYQADVSEPISIRVTLAGLPVELRQQGVFGLHLNGLDTDGELHQDPEDEHEVCVTVSLTVDAELEPKWTFFRPDKSGDEAVLSSASRRLIGVYKVDERIDIHLRWSKMSALGRLTEDKQSTSRVLVDASRAARGAVRAAIPPELQGVTDSVQGKMREIGSGDFKFLQPGLDISLSNSSGNLALHEGEIPLTSYGLGTRRLTGIAAQQLANDGRSFLLIDEVEYGLEPHRLVSLLTNLRQPDLLGQTFATTHSPVVLRNLEARDLAIVRAGLNGEVTVHSLDDDPGIQSLIRASPEALLAKRVILGEGKTEYGLLLGLLEHWDLEAALKGDPVSAALGVVAVEGSGETTVTRGELLEELGYEVTLLMDSDVERVNKLADALGERAGAEVVRWQDNFNVERAVCEVLDVEGLTALMQLAISLSDHPEGAQKNYLAHLHGFGLDKVHVDLDVANWIQAGVTLNQARQIIATSASKRNWFKQVSRGRALAEALLNAKNLEGSNEHSKLLQLRTAIFKKHVDASSNSGQSPPESE